MFSSKRKKKMSILSLIYIYIYIYIFLGCFLNILWFNELLWYREMLCLKKKLQKILSGRLLLVALQKKRAIAVFEKLSYRP